MNFVFFTFRDFKKEGGGTIRMYGVLNALAKNDIQITFISNAQDYSKFDSGIKHVFLDLKFLHKSFFQALLAILPATLVALLFRKYLTRVNETITKNSNPESRLFFFEYLDNSLGYLLKKTGRISNYYNDIHGIATIEFDYQSKTTNSFLKKILFRLKFYLAHNLDKKVMENADGIIFSSKVMQQFFSGKYNIESVKSYILPNLLAENVAENRIDLELQKTLRNQYNIRPHETVLFFAGGFKPTAGVDDLVEVFFKLTEKYKHLKLILIGEGPSRNEVNTFVKKNDLDDQVIFIDRIDYQDLLTYQSLSDIIICPDKMNGFSNMIIHLKYLDSLLSNKIVLNGAFDSVREINPNEELSINFTPSDRENLYDKLTYSIDHIKILSEKYSTTKIYALKNLTYQSYINTLLY